MTRGLRLSEADLMKLKGEAKAKAQKARHTSTSQGFDPFQALCVAHGLPMPAREVKFHPVRLWRFDYGWEPQKLALEQEGGIWLSGRHTRGAGFEEDCLKYAEAAFLGWTVLRASVGQVTDGTALEWVKRLLELRR